jgi:hypothetical protein
VISNCFPAVRLTPRSLDCARDDKVRSVLEQALRARSFDVATSCDRFAGGQDDVVVSVPVLDPSLALEDDSTGGRTPPAEAVYWY